MDKFKVLICEDDRDFLDWIEEHLKEANFECITATNGEEVLALRLDELESVALFVLDILLPGKNGVDVATELREKTCAPILFLTAQNKEPYLRAMGIDNCQYIIKSAKLTAEALLSYVRNMLKGLYRIGRLTLNDNLKDVFENGNSKNLTKTEYQVFKILAFHQQQCLTADSIIGKMNAGKPDCDGGDEGSIRMHVKSLREKLGKACIRTERGKGYRLGDVK